MKSLWLSGAAVAALAAGVALAGPTAAGTVISGAGNGAGNRIAVSGSSGTTVIQGSRAGVGNSITVENNGSSVVVNDDGVTIDGVCVTKPTKSIWSQRKWSEECGAYLYWSAKAKGWYRFHSA